MRNANRAVLLLNLGSPDSTSVADVRRYLREFLMDERVIDKPFLSRWLVVNAFILPVRPKRSAEAYATIWEPEGSPLLLISKRLQEQVQEQVDVPVALAMRYGQPAIADVVAQLHRDGCRELFVVPLYPQYAMSSYETVVVRTMEEVRRHTPLMKTTLLQPFYQDADYIDVLVGSAQPWLVKEYDQLLFSFHGIPERHLRKSDPSHSHCLTTPDCCSTCHPAHATCYRHQCYTTARLFAERAGIPEDKWSVSFQSRLGRDPWLRPYTDHRLRELPGEGVRRLLVICPAFVSDCLETLEEIRIAGRETFIEAGGESFEQIPCMNNHPAWVNWLVRRIVENFSNSA